MDPALTQPNDAPENRPLSILPNDLVTQREGAHKRASNALWDREMRTTPIVLLRSSINANAAIVSPHRKYSGGRGIDTAAVGLGLTPFPRCLHPRMPPVRGGLDWITRTRHWIRLDDLDSEDFFRYCDSVVGRGTRGARRGLDDGYAAHLPSVHSAAPGAPPSGAAARWATRFRLLWDAPVWAECGRWRVIGRVLAECAV
ncbi:hypothetical protein DFH09DRAFT_1375964 [Mycena vulgaris]|nr:hypothetical protein DFH09DRAFT_1375964 [Mycena vulgaris]